MGKGLVALGALAAVAMAWGGPAAAAADPPVAGRVACDRACLQGMVDRTLAAFVAHNPGSLPLAASVRYTENGQELALGDGFWATASDQGKYKHYFLDPRTNQAGFFGVMKENGQLVILALRLKLEDRLISEIEAVFGRTGLGTAGPSGAAYLEQLGKPDDIWMKDIPPAERATREDIIRVSDMYFTGLENNDGKGDYSFFADDCYRLENGMQTTSGPHPRPPPPGGASAPRRAGPDVLSMGCRQGFETGYFKIVTRIRDRRFPLVDEDKGVAFAFAFFDHSGAVHNYRLTDGTVMPGGLNAPFTWEIAEAFKVEKGKITVVEAVLNNAPYGMKAGWEGK